MSLKIIKSGVLDTLQDGGRWGFQNFGINLNGVMDHFAAKLANCLLAKSMNNPVVEIHFPAPVIVFEKATIICITGADFSPAVDNVNIPLNQPVIVNRNTILNFKGVNSGARCYLSLLQDFSLRHWLNSYSTNLKAEAGGYNGRPLRKGDVLHYPNNDIIDKILKQRNFVVLPFKAQPFEATATKQIEVIEGSEWNWLTEESQAIFKKDLFKISTIADRMGYRLQGSPLKIAEQKHLVSSAVSFGTLQLLPNGQVIVLMADHQTTGGYPKVAHVISAHLPVLAQMKPNETFTFKMVDVETAQQKLLKQHKYLLCVQNASVFKIEKILQL